MSRTQERQARVAEANALIELIASHGRQFFRYRGRAEYNAKDKNTTWYPANRVARFELRNGRLYYVDEYSQRAVYLQRTGFRNAWFGFTHGGTLRALVESMRDYILDGTPVPRWQIVIQQRDANGLENNIWGYDVASAQAVRAAAYTMAIVAA